MNCLVTGGAGFIGSHLVVRLLSLGHKVVVLDKGREGKRIYLNHLKSKNKIKNLTIHKVDITQKDQLKNKYFKKIDWVFHLAAVVRGVEKTVSPTVFHEVNVSGTVNVLLPCLQNKIKKIIFASTASCYGVPDIYPTPETAEIKIESIYGLSKYLAELYTLYFSKLYNLPVIVLRMPSVYGPKIKKGGGYGSIISLFMGQKEKGQPLTIVGDGSQRRDLVFVEDVASAMILAAKSKVSGQVFNVGCGDSFSIKKIISLLGGKVTYLPAQPWEAKRTQLDISKIKTVLGWQPKVSLEEGIKRVLKRATGNAKCKNQNAK